MCYTHVVEGKVLCCRGHLYGELNGVDGGAGGKRPVWEGRDHVALVGLSLEATFRLLPTLKLLIWPVEKCTRIKASGAERRGMGRCRGPRGVRIEVGVKVAKGV